MDSCKKLNSLYNVIFTDKSEMYNSTGSSGTVRNSFHKYVKALSCITAGKVCSILEYQACFLHKSVISIIIIIIIITVIITLTIKII